MKKIYLRILSLSLGSLLAAAIATPASFSYANWSSATASSGAGAGSASGTLTVGSTTININYSGDLTSDTQVGAGGTNYYTPTGVYTNSTVGNTPTNNNILTLSESPAYTDTLTFSAPVVNPILDIVSLGSPGTVVTYTFDSAPVLLSQGVAYWGGCATCLSVSGDSLSGTEGSGVIEFVGTFDEISWTTTGGENWNGFTVGTQGLASVSAAPEPATWTMALGMFGVVGGLIRMGKREK